MVANPLHIESVVLSEMIEHGGFAAFEGTLDDIQNLNPIIKKLSTRQN